MRIAIGGVAHETNTFSTLPTRRDDFRRVSGQALLAGSYWQGLLRQGHDLVPLFTAHATPSGRVTRQAFEALLHELLDGLRAALPLDGALLVLHGAMEVEGLGDGETAILAAVRRLVGPQVFLTATLDLHANLAPAVVAQCDLITAYRTAPHRDMEETRQRGMTLMLDCLAQGVRPVSHLCKLPLLVAGEAAVTEVEPTRSLYARLPQLDSLPGLLTSSILIGCAWTDSPHSTVSVVTYGVEPLTVRREAERLAAAIWAARAQFVIDSPTASLADAVAQALAAPERPVFLSDSGDNITAGAAGDLPLFVAYLVDQRVPNALVAGICDPAAVEQCFAAGPGAALELSLGGKLDAVNAAPYRCQAQVLRLVPEVEGIPLRALVRVGTVDLVVQTHRDPFTERRHFASMGLDPAAYKLVVVKEGYLFPELRDDAPRHIMALSSGFSDQRLDQLPYQHLTRPIYPLDAAASWEPGK